MATVSIISDTNKDKYDNDSCKWNPPISLK